MDYQVVNLAEHDLLSIVLLAIIDGRRDLTEQFFADY